MVAGRDCVSEWFLNCTFCAHIRKGQRKDDVLVDRLFTCDSKGTFFPGIHAGTTNNMRITVDCFLKLIENGQCNAYIETDIDHYSPF
jgi:hypothetical protein